MFLALNVYYLRYPSEARWYPTFLYSELKLHFDMAIALIK